MLERMAETGADSFRSYFIALRFERDGRELQQLVNTMTVNETYFFRESYQFDCMVNDLLAEVVRRKRPGERIRIWSIPSSTGEEPYSIAIYLLERWPLIDQYEVEIMSSDIDTTVLAAAQRGIYSPRSVANLPPEYLAKWPDAKDYLAALQAGANSGLLDLSLLQTDKYEEALRQMISKLWAGEDPKAIADAAAAEWDAIADKIGVDKQKAVYSSWASKSGAYPKM